MSKRLILIADKNLDSGMTHLAKSLGGDVKSLKKINAFLRVVPSFLKDKFDISGYDEVVTFLYPMHLFGKVAQKKGLKWIVYDCEIPPLHHFKGIKRLYMALFTYFNNRYMKGCDELWTFDMKKHWPKPRFVGKKDYVLYLGRKTYYKGFAWLKDYCEFNDIPLVWTDNFSDDAVHALISNAKVVAVPSVWEGFGLPVYESQALYKPVVCFNVGQHKRIVKKGSVIDLGCSELLNRDRFIKELIRWYRRK